MTGREKIVPQTISVLPPVPVCRCLYLFCLRDSHKFFRIAEKAFVQASGRSTLDSYRLWERCGNDASTWTRTFRALPTYGVVRSDLPPDTSPTACAPARAAARTTGIGITLLLATSFYLLFFFRALKKISSFLSSRRDEMLGDFVCSLP